MRKILAVIMALALCVGVMTMTVAAADTGSVTVTSASANRGDSVSVIVKINANPGFASMIVTPSYDTNALSLTSIENAGTLNFFTGNAASLPGFADTTYTGDILKLNFAVKNDAVAGSYPVSVTIQAGNANEEDVIFNVTAGSVKVLCTHNWAAEWSKDGTNHWLACTIGNGCTETKDLAGHTYGDWIIDTAATCDAAGAKHRECSVCGHVENATIAATGEHSYTWVKEDGTNHKGTCACGETKTEGHSWNAGEVTTQPTCKDAGVKTYTCTVCNAAKTEPIEATGEHSYAWEKEDETNHKGTCACGETKTEGHSWNAGEVTTQPTCKDAGVKTYTCTVCKATKTEPIAATGEHNYVTVEQIEGDLENHKVSCGCGEFKTEKHTWKPGKVTKPATCGTAGEQPYSCTCGATKTEVIAATGEHDHTEKYQDNEDGKTHTAYCACGDAKTEDHDYSINGKVTVTPTKTSEGKQEMLCTCGAKIVKTLPKVSADLDDVPKTGDITPHIVLSVVAVMVMLTVAFAFKRKFAK